MHPHARTPNTRRARQHAQQRVDSVARTGQRSVQLNLSTRHPTMTASPSTSKASPGLPALKRSLVDQVLAGKYVDFGELPPAKGLGKASPTMSGDMEGQIVLIQAADYLQSRRQVKDYATWNQCFALYAAVLLSKHQDRAQSLFQYGARPSLRN